MSKKKMRDITAVFWIGLFVLTFEPVFLWLLVGFMVLMQTEGSHKIDKKEAKGNVLFAIGADARKYGLKMPRRMSTRSLLIRVYQSYFRSVEAYPHLKTEYSEVLEEMWASLAAEEEPEAKDRIVSSVLAGWPQTTRTGFQSVQSKLKKVSELTSQWDEAKEEVRGGASV